MSRVVGKALFRKKEEGKAKESHRFVVCLCTKINNFKPNVSSSLPQSARFQITVSLFSTSPHNVEGGRILGVFHGGPVYTQCSVGNVDAGAVCWVGSVCAKSAPILSSTARWRKIPEPTMEAWTHRLEGQRLGIKTRPAPHITHAMSSNTPPFHRRGHLFYFVFITIWMVLCFFSLEDSADQYISEDALYRGGATSGFCRYTAVYLCFA